MTFTPFISMGHRIRSSVLSQYFKSCWSTCSKYWRKLSCMFHTALTGESWRSSKQKTLQHFSANCSWLILFRGPSACWKSRTFSQLYGMTLISRPCLPTHILCRCAPHDPSVKVHLSKLIVLFKWARQGSQCHPKDLLFTKSWLLDHNNIQQLPGCLYFLIYKRASQRACQGWNLERAQQDAKEWSCSLETSYSCISWGEKNWTVVHLDSN